MFLYKRPFRESTFVGLSNCFIYTQHTYRHRAPYAKEGRLYSGVKTSMQLTFHTARYIVLRYHFF